jgi:hypothetical protein
VATRSFEFRNEAERMRREVEAYKDQVRIATLKKDEANLKLEDTEDLLRNALEENSKVGEKFKALEAEIAAREKAAFDRGSVQAQTIMTKQLPGIYNEAFQQGWKALYSWAESDDMPQLPPQENLPYRMPQLASLKKSFLSLNHHPTRRPGRPTLETLCLYFFYSHLQILRDLFLYLFFFFLSDPDKIDTFHLFFYMFMMGFSILWPSF